MTDVEYRITKAQVDNIQSLLGGIDDERKKLSPTGVLAEYEGLTISVLPHKGKLAGKIGDGFRFARRCRETMARVCES